MKNIQKILQWCKSNWFSWLLDGIRMILVATLSYVILKECQKIIRIEDFWKENERIYLGSYVTIQIVITFLFYSLVGKLIEVLTYRWIKKNRRKYTIELERSEEKEVKEYINGIVEIVLKFNLLSETDLEIFTDISIDQEEYRKKWRQTVETIKRLFGIFILVLINVLVYPSLTDWFWWITPILIVLGFLSFVGLLIYFVIVENLRIVDLALKSVSLSSRLLRKRSFIKIKRIGKK